MVKQNPFPNEQELIAKLFSFQDDPYAFVMYAFPWGEPGTPLEKSTGPRAWQVRALKEMRDHIKRNRRAVSDGRTPTLCRIARSSGRGIGKSAFLAWIAIWMVSTLPSATVMVSANTEGQLKGTTFPEIKKWATLGINAHWWEHAAMSIKPQSWLVDALKKSTKLDSSYWYIDARLWSEENPDAFAGAHSQTGMTLLFDEASGIPSNIWSVAEGFFTDKTIHRFWVAISNPRNPTGAFFECFHRMRDFWQCENIDARTVSENDQSLYDAIIAQHGAESDQARVEVYGQFPETGDYQFIGRKSVDDAGVRETYAVDAGAPLIMGVDPARFGNDNAVFAFRRGKDARTIPWEVYPHMDLVTLAEMVMTANERHKPDAIMIEGDGVGGGLVDILKSYGVNIIEVKTGGGAIEKDMYVNHRVEMWGRMRDWLGTGCIPSDDALLDDLCAPEYKYTLKGQLQLEAKDMLKKRGYASPDRADALALTFSKKISRLDSRTSRNSGPRRKRLAIGSSYDIFG